MQANQHSSIRLLVNRFTVAKMLTREGKGEGSWCKANKNGRDVVVRGSAGRSKDGRLPDILFQDNTILMGWQVLSGETLVDMLVIMLYLKLPELVRRSRPCKKSCSVVAG